MSALYSGSASGRQGGGRAALLFVQSVWRIIHPPVNIYIQVRINYAYYCLTGSIGPGKSAVLAKHITSYVVNRRLPNVDG